MSAILTAAILLGVQKPKPKPQAPKPKPALGQVQMAGDNGQVGTTYSVGDKGTELNFTLESAEFALRAPMADETVVAKKEEKILLLTFSVANPQKFEQNFVYSSFAFTAVAPDDENSEYSGHYYHPERKTHLDTTLKPAQRVKAVIAFPIHGKGPVNKLIVKRGNGKVLRYDLREKVKPLAGPFATEGVTARDKAEVPLNSTFELGRGDWTVEAVEEFPGKLGRYNPIEEHTMFGITVKAGNPGLMPMRVSWNTLRPRLVDENGEEIEWLQDYLGMSSGQTIDSEVAPGEFVKGRLAFRAAKGVKPAKLTLEDPATGRQVTVALP